MSGVPEVRLERAESTPSAGLRSRHDGHWQALVDNPFVAAMATGELPPTNFRFYIEQNIQYLHCYANTIAVGAAKSRSHRSLARFTGSLRQIVDVELDHNHDMLRRIVDLGADDRDGAREMAPATLAYTSYLTATAFRGEPVEILAAMMPCAWSYLDIGRRYPEPAPHPVYADWILFFGGDVYADYIAAYLAYFDEAARDVGEDIGRRLDEHFLAGARLERAFWDMGHGLIGWPDAPGAPGDGS